jgi:hypothetical protein
MKCSIKFSVIFLLFSVFASAQNKEKENEKTVRTVKNFINIYYGPSIINSIYKTFAKNALDNQPQINIKSNSFGPVGIVYENMVTDIVGIGGEFGYSKFNLSITDYITNTQGNSVPFEYKFDWTTIRAMLRSNFHLKTGSSNFDAYGLISAGFRYTSLKFSTNDPSFNLSRKWSTIPLGFKAGIGFRYFFIPNVGINAELAAGTPIICGGLSVKF